MKKFNSQKYFCKENFGTLKFKTLVLLQIVKELTASTQVNDKAVIVCCLKGILERYQKWTLQLAQNITFAKNLCKSVLILHDLCLFDSFHCIQFTCGTFTYHIYCGKATFTDNFDEFKVSQAWYSIFLLFPVVLLKIKLTNIVYAQLTCRLQKSCYHFIFSCKKKVNTL